MQCSCLEVHVRCQRQISASKTDFLGTKTVYSYDLTRNLETSRTEASQTTAQRIIATEWDARFRLPKKITEPGRLTTFTYNDDANLTGKTVTADGKTRSWVWTWNTHGQVTSATDPVGSVTRYDYDPVKGDLIPAHRR